MKEKKVVPQESNSPSNGLRRKNHIVFPPHIPQAAADDDDLESSSAVASSKEAQVLEEVDVTLIDQYDPHLHLPLHRCPSCIDGDTPTFRRLSTVGCSNYRVAISKGYYIKRED